ncbi:hypothetical protein P23_0386 [Acinetobacter calcoaceticus]|nr:hypothetical protein P23_0386 [Acinetobacter calcoaceticus]
MDSLGFKVQHNKNLAKMDIPDLKNEYFLVSSDHLF